MNENIILALLSPIVITFILMPILIKYLKKLHLGQNIRTEGPKDHQKKAGTPTMGGIVIIIAVLLSSLYFINFNLNNPLTLKIEIMLALFLFLGHGILGFIDDYIKIACKRNLGLTAAQKIVGQIFIVAVYLYISQIYLGKGTELWIPFLNVHIDFAFFYFLIVLFLIVGTTNAVNLTDGLDGLLSGVTIPVAVAYAIIALTLGKIDLAIFAFSLAGACIGFLRFNMNPAKIFMGDTGSLAIGGGIAALALLTSTEMLLITLGGVYVIEALSVIIQVISFKSRGKRVFKMSPIHHHFELSGWNEKKVVAVFWFVSLFFTTISLMVWKYSNIGVL